MPPPTAHALPSLAPAFFRAAAANRPVPAAVRWIDDSRYSLLLMLLVWLLVVLMTVPEDFDYSALSGGSALPATGSPGSRLAWLSLLGGSALVLLPRRSLAVRWWHYLNPWLPALALLAALSLAWSIEPAFTLRRLVRLLTFMLVAAALVLRGWHPRRLQEVLRPVLTLLLAGSLLFGLIDPTLAIHQETSPELLGAWRGLANHKNSLGALSCLGLIFWIHGWLAGEVRRPVALLGYAISGACLVLSRSSTSMMAAAFAAAILVLLQRPTRASRPYQPYLVAALAAAVMLYLTVVLRLLPGISVLLAPLTALTGKDMGMTGRSDIWNVITDQIHQHPWLGCGYGAFWTGVHPDAASYVFMQRLGFYPASAHNGYLEVVNDLGMLGAACLAGYLLVYLRQCLRLLRFDLHQAALYLALFMQEAVVNLSESHWFSVLSLNFTVMILATAALARELLERELRQRYGDPQPAAPPPPADAH